MNKKPVKVEEPATSYGAIARKKAASKSQANAPHVSKETAFQKIADKVFTERKELLRKLAQ